MNRTHWTISDFTYIAIIVAPIIILSGLFVTSAITWQIEKQKLDATINDLIGQDNLLDYSTMAAIYDRQTSPEHTLTWKSILAASQDLNEQYGGPFAWSTDDGAYDDLVLPGNDWPVAEIMSQYANDADPIIDDIETLLDSDETIWLPIVFQSFHTNLSDLQQYRSVARLLHYSFLSSIHENDHARALVILRANDRLFGDSYEAIDLVDELIRMACHSHLQSSLRSSLAAPVWNDEELAQIEPIVSKGFDWDERWKKTTTIEALETLPGMLAVDIGNADSGMDMPIVPQLPAPSSLRSTIESQLQIASIRGAGSNQHVDAARNASQLLWDRKEKLSFDRWMQLPTMSSAWNNLYIASYEAVASAYRREANEHRFTRSVFALRKFHSKFDRWPDALTELTQVGLPIAETDAFDGGPFSYEVRDDGTAVIFNQADTKVTWAFMGEKVDQVVMVGKPPQP